MDEPGATAGDRDPVGQAMLVPSGREGRRQRGQEPAGRGDARWLAASRQTSDKTRRRAPEPRPPRRCQAAGPAGGRARPRDPAPRSASRRRRRASRGARRECPRRAGRGRWRGQGAGDPAPPSAARPAKGGPLLKQGSRSGCGGAADPTKPRCRQQGHADRGQTPKFTASMADLLQKARHSIAARRAGSRACPALEPAMGARAGVPQSSADAS